MYLEQIIVKKHPIWAKLGAFLSKMVYWWVGNQVKNWYGEGQIFETRQAHPCSILAKVKDLSLFSPFLLEVPSPNFSSSFIHPGDTLVIFIEVTNEQWPYLSAEASWKNLPNFSLSFFFFQILDQFSPLFHISSPVFSTFSCFYHFSPPQCWLPHCQQNKIHTVIQKTSNNTIRILILGRWSSRCITDSR